MDEIKELEDEIERFNKDRDWDQFHTPATLSKSIAIEAGELLECFQWSDSDYDESEVKAELADVIIYCLQLATTMNVDVSEIVREKLKENAAKYPVSKAKGSALKYNKLK